MRARAGTEVLRLLGAKTLVLYHRPEGPAGRRFPTVLFLHGLPGSEKSVDVQRALLSKGVASVAPHFHGAWGSGGTYRFSTLVAQARAVLRAASRLDFVDSRRVAVYGFSMGGWTALNLAAAEPRLKAVAAIAPVDGAPMSGRGTSWLAALSRPLNAPSPSALARDFARAMKAHDAGRAAARLKAPLLLVHGDRDETVPVEVSRRLRRLARGPATLVVERGASHDFLDRRAALARRVSGWLARRV